jgi:hypothetical protein
MARSRGDGDGGVVDGHRYTIAPSGMVTIYASRADGGTQRRFFIKTKSGESVDLLEGRIRAKLEGEGALGIGADADPDVAPTTGDEGTRRSKRTHTAAREEAFSHSRAWSTYERARADERHRRTRDFSHDQLVGFATCLPPIVALLAKSHSAHRDLTPAVRALQLALAELIDADELIDVEAAAALPQQLEAEEPEQEQRAVDTPSLRVARPRTSAGGSTVVQPRVAASVTV